MSQPHLVFTSVVLTLPLWLLKPIPNNLGLILSFFPTFSTISYHFFPLLRLHCVIFCWKQMDHPSSLGSSSQHPSQPLVSEDLLSQYLKSPETAELDKNALEWLPSMLEGGALKLLGALAETQRWDVMDAYTELGDGMMCCQEYLWRLSNWEKAICQSLSLGDSVEMNRLQCWKNLDFMQLGILKGKWKEVKSEKEKSRELEPVPFSLATFPLNFFKEKGSNLWKGNSWYLKGKGIVRI